MDTRELIPAPGQVHRPAPLLTEPDQLKPFVPGLTETRLEEARDVAQTFNFRLPAFYAEHVLTGDADDPLLTVVMPSEEERLDGPELWDATAYAKPASKSRFWVQKYPHQGLIRLTTYCSGVCRYCYLKRKNERMSAMRVEDVDALFDDLGLHGADIDDIILSGGDPLCAPHETLSRIAERVEDLRFRRGSATPFVSVHTREPVWNPTQLLASRGLWSTLARVQAKAIMLHVIHPREVTPEFGEVCARLSEVGGPKARPALLCQHPLLHGVNDSVDILETLYVKLLSLSPPVVPYYLVYPFYNGTLVSQKLPLQTVQALYRELCSRPGWFTPRLVVPTPWGKCIVGPNDPLVAEDGSYRLRTKEGREVRLP